MTYFNIKKNIEDKVLYVFGIFIELVIFSTCAFGILTKWFSLTRLETRTKESNIYASS